MSKEKEKNKNSRFIIDAQISLFDPEKEKPKPDPELEYLLSLDVFIIDEAGLNGIAYYNFDTKKWGFHSDTIGKYTEKTEIKWLWYYPPVNKDDLFF